MEFDGGSGRVVHALPWVSVLPFSRLEVIHVSRCMQLREEISFLVSFTVTLHGGSRTTYNEWKSTHEEINSWWCMNYHAAISMRYLFEFCRRWSFMLVHVGSWWWFMSHRVALWAFCVLYLDLVHIVHEIWLRFIHHHGNTNTWPHEIFHDLRGALWYFLMRLHAYPNSLIVVHSGSPYSMKTVSVLHGTWIMLCSGCRCVCISSIFCTPYVRTCQRQKNTS